MSERMGTPTRVAVGAAAAAGAVAAGLAGRALWRHRRPAGGDRALGRRRPRTSDRSRPFDGTKLAVRAAGPPDGPILVFSHGFSLDMTTWREQWPDLGDEFRCVALDHRAHGRSEVPPTGDVSLRSMGRDLATVLDAVVPRPAGRADRSLDGGDGDPRPGGAAAGPVRTPDRGGRAPRRVRVGPAAWGDGWRHRAPPAPARIARGGRPPGGSPPQGDPRGTHRGAGDRRARDAVRAGGAGRRRRPCPPPRRAHVVPSSGPTASPS